jgi:hypothetical protein
MFKRTLVALAALALIGNVSLFAKQNTSTKVGQHLVLQMTGDLAVEYAKCTGSINKDNVPPGLEIETTATIVQQLEDGLIRVEHTSHIVRDGEPDRLVTLTSTVDSTKLTTDVTPKGTEVYASPGAKPTRTTTETQTLRLSLSDLQALKLRTWTLAEELGD